MFCHKRGNDFSVGEAKIGEKQSTRSNSKYNFTQLCIMYAVYNEVWGKGGIFEKFCVKSNLTVCKVTFDCKLQKNGGAGYTSCSPNNLLGEQLLALLPRSPRLCSVKSIARGRCVRRVVGVLSASFVSQIARSSSDYVLRGCHWLRCACCPSNHHRSNCQSGR